MQHLAGKAANAAFLETDQDLMLCRKTAQQIPVKATIAQEFGVFNKVRCLGLFLFSNSHSRPHRPAVLRCAGGVNAQPPVHAIGNQLRRCR